MIRLLCFVLALLVSLDSGVEAQIFRRRNAPQQPQRPPAANPRQPGVDQQRNATPPRGLQAAQPQSRQPATPQAASDKKPQTPLSRGDQRRQARAARKNPNPAASSKTPPNPWDSRRYATQPVSPNGRSVVDQSRPGALAANAQRRPAGAALPRPVPANQYDLARPPSSQAFKSVIQAQAAPAAARPQPAPSPALVGPDELSAPPASGKPSVLAQRPPKGVAVPAAKKSPTPAQPPTEGQEKRTYSILEWKDAGQEEAPQESSSDEARPSSSESLKSILEPVG